MNGGRAARVRPRDDATLRSDGTTADRVAGPPVRRLLLVIVLLGGLSILAVRSGTPRPPAFTGLAVPAEVMAPPEVRYAATATQCQEIRLPGRQFGVQLRSADAALWNPSDHNILVWADVRVDLYQGAVTGTVLGTPDQPFSMGPGMRAFGMFGWAPPLSGRPASVAHSSIVSADGQPVPIPERQLSACTVTFHVSK